MSRYASRSVKGVTSWCRSFLTWRTRWIRWWSGSHFRWTYARYQGTLQAWISSPCKSFSSSAWVVQSNQDGKRIALASSATKADLATPTDPECWRSMLQPLPRRWNRLSQSRISSKSRWISWALIPMMSLLSAIHPMTEAAGKVNLHWCTLWWVPGRKPTQGRLHCHLPR